MQAQVHEPRLIDLTVHVDDRGCLYEVVHNYELPWDLETLKENEVPKSHRFGQCYIVEDPAPFTIRAFHRHKVLWDYFCIVHGRAVFCLVSPDKKVGKRLVLDAKKPQLLVVPPGWYHGWMSLVPGTILLSVGSELYNRENPDEERVPFDSFDRIFGGNPWEIRPR